MAIAQAPSTRSERGARSGAFLARHKMVIAVELVLLAAFIALTVIVTGHLAPLPGDVGLTVWWQHLVRAHQVLTTIFDAARAINFPSGVGITLLVLVALFALFRRWLDLLVAGAVLVINEVVFFLNNEFVRRPRPTGYGIVVDQNITKIYGVYSFPSDLVPVLLVPHHHEGVAHAHGCAAG